MPCIEIDAPSISTCQSSIQLDHILVAPGKEAPGHAGVRVVLSSGLGDIVDVREKAILMHCLHVFCVDCLNRWLPVKRLCPLCKVRRIDDQDRCSGCK